MMPPHDPRFGPPNPYGPPQYPPYGGYGPPPPYSPYPYAMTTAPADDSEATNIFVLGLLGIVLCQICAPIAWVKGSTYRTTCRITGTPPSGLATAGWIMGIIGTLMFVLSILLVVLALALGS